MGIIVEYQRFKQQVISSKAAGISRDRIPPVIPIHDNFALKFTLDPAQNLVYMELEGGDGATRCLLEIHIFYSLDTEPEIFYGKDKKRGGRMKHIIYAN